MHCQRLTPPGEAGSAAAIEAGAIHCYLVGRWAAWQWVGGMRYFQPSPTVASPILTPTQLEHTTPHLPTCALSIPPCAQYPRTDPVVIMLVESPDGQSAVLGRSKAMRPGMLTALSGFVDQARAGRQQQGAVMSRAARCHVCLHEHAAMAAIAHEHCRRTYKAAQGRLRCWVTACMPRSTQPLQGEAIEEAVRRETREEAGVELVAVDIVGSQPWPVGE